MENQYESFSTPPSLLNQFHPEYDETSGKRLGKEMVKNVLDDILWTKGGEFRGSSTQCAPGLPKSKTIQIDKRLDRWQAQLAQHIKLSQKLSKATGKTKAALLINRNEDFRKTVQCQTIFDVAERLSPSKLLNRSFGKLRGSPPVLETLPKTEREAIPFQTFTEMPAVALEEQGVEQSQNHKWFQSEYLNKRCGESKEKITRVFEHYPDMGSIQIVGTKLIHSTDGSNKKKSHIPKPEFRIEEQWYGDQESSLENTISVNGKHFDANHKYRTNYIFPFTFESAPYQYQVKTLIIQNRGSRSIDIEWTRLDSRPDWLSARQTVPSFYFNKNSQSIKPGSVNNINIIFCCKESGCFEEYWQMRTNPTFLEENYSLNISLFGYCQTYDLSRDNIFRIENGLNEGPIVENGASDNLHSMGFKLDVTQGLHSDKIVGSKKEEVYQNKRNENYERFESIMREMKICPKICRPQFDYYQKFLLAKRVFLDFVDSIQEVIESLRTTIMDTDYNLNFDEVLIAVSLLANCNYGKGQSKTNYLENRICVIKSEHVRKRKIEAFYQSLFIRLNCLFCNAIDEIVGIIEGTNNIE